MRYNEPKKITTQGVVIFSFAAIVIALIVMTLIGSVAALLVLKTEVGNGVLKVGSVLGSSLGVAIAAALLTIVGRFKGIVSATVVGLSIIAIKIAGNVWLGMGGYLNWNGIIGILFVFVFALVGGVVGTALKQS